MFNPGEPYNSLPMLPPRGDMETNRILKMLSEASGALGRLNGIDTLSDNKISLLVMEPLLVPESVSSNEIEGIHTTVKDFFDAEASTKTMIGNNKEVSNYRDAILRGFKQIEERNGLILNDIITIQEFLEPNKAGIQSSPGKKIMDAARGKVLYTPPQGEQILNNLMDNLEKYINNDLGDSIHPLIKMCIIHYQFEAIHPFLDGNGRTGRIIMILYLVLKELLSLPILFLSGYINKNRQQYYKLLNNVTKEEDRESYILYMLQGVKQQADHTTKQLIDINTLINSTKKTLHNIDSIKFSDRFLMALFEKPSFSIPFLEQKAGLHRNTIAKYLKILVDQNIIYTLKDKQSHKIYLIRGFREILQRTEYSA